MDFLAFERLAEEVFADIPTEYREGVDGLEVSRAAIPHPTLPDIYTLGECKSESYPTEFGGAGVVRSVVVLYYGSFVALSRLDEEWDWEAEIFQTITHEIQHHLEALADEETLDELDYAEDQNFARREGEPFEPFFYRSGVRAGPAAWEVDRDVFIEIPVGRQEISAGSTSVEHEGQRYQLTLTGVGPQVDFVPLAEIDDGRGELIAVVIRKRGIREWIKRLFLRPPAVEGVAHKMDPNQHPAGE